MATGKYETLRDDKRFSADPRTRDILTFLACETETSNCFERETFRLLKFEHQI